MSGFVGCRGEDIRCPGPRRATALRELGMLALLADEEPRPSDGLFTREARPLAPDNAQTATDRSCRPALM